MARVQSSPAGKLLAWVLLLVLSFAAVRTGQSALAAVLLSQEDWQSTSAFSALLQARQYQLAQYCIDCLDWEFLQANGAYDAGGSVDPVQLQDDIQVAEAELDPQATAFRFQLRTRDGGTMLSNLEDGQRLSQAVERVHYSILTTQPVPELERSLQWSASSAEWGTLYLYNVEAVQDTLSALTDAQCYILACGVPAVPPDTVDDEFSALFQQCTAAEAGLVPFSMAAAACAILAVVCLGYILWTSGHRAGHEGIFLSWQDRVFLEVHALVCAGLLLLLFWGIVGALEVLSSLFYASVTASTAADDSTTLLMYAVSLLAALCMGTVALLLRTVAVRCKARALTQTSLLCRAVGWVVRTVRDFVLGLPLTWRVVAAFLIYFFLNLALFTNGRYSAMFAGLWLGLNLAVLLALAWWTLHFRRLREGSRAIAGGNLNHKIETQRMPRDLRLYAEDLNNISAGISTAVNEQMKSERFKAELITNVSHDLKTPLTSIINYVNLLKSTRQEDPKALEYIEVLDRKSQRLKKLTEDLVEASKASTGALSVNREKIGMGQLIDQALGEWTEKLEERKLTVVPSLPEGETWVYADGRHLWRVVDNLLSNCAKYAMEGTRVYLDLVRGRGQVTLAVKNISREPLNVPPDRLMERFVRGDESRTTEGSGLGLSIARSLTELQGGVFTLEVDGDLFKAVVTLPQAG